MDKTVKFEGKYKFSFGFNFWSKDRGVWQIDKELKDAAMHDKEVGNKVVVGPTSRRSMGHKG